MFSAILAILKYAPVFLGIYIQLFLLFTYLGWGTDNTDDAENNYTDDQLPTIGVIIPCFNEEMSVLRTVDSLLAADYPHEKLQILVVNDGSTDKTWEMVQKYAGNPRVFLYSKQNGGKYTALNFGLEKTNAAIVGCLDADSTIAPDALKQSAYYFLNDSAAYAVVPTLIVENPKTFMQYVQKVEFEGALYMRKVFGSLGALFVAPGPLTLFRREVFEKLGPYRHGYLGEDLEIAVRMQFNKMKLIYGNKVNVYTFGMKTLKTLLKQRVRWTYAFIMNMKDYRKMLLNPEYGHLGLFIFPIALIGIVLAVVMVPIALFNLIKSLWMYLHPVFWGMKPAIPHIDGFFLSTQSMSLLAIIAITFATAAIFIGRSLNKQKMLSIDLFTLCIYPFVSALWMWKTIWKMVRSERITWR